MSIAPFLPGLLAPAPAPSEAGTTTGTASGQTTDGQPGAEGEVAFMDALAAALAVQPMVATPPPMATATATPATPATPALAATGTTGSTGSTGASGASGSRGVGRATPAVPAVPAVPATPATGATPVAASDLDRSATPATPATELGFVTPESGFGTAESGLPTTALPPPNRNTTQQPTLGVAGTSIVATPDEAATDGPVRTTSAVDVPADLTQVPAPSFELPTVTNPDSIVTSPNSGVTSPNSAVTDPKSVERAVATQVFPEVTRLASSGNGTHRITLTLQPAQLGEVRVTLVVRDGTVRVRMSGEAGDGAVRQALATGAPELQRMLERAGASEARVLVRDVNATPLLTTPTPASRNDFGQGWSQSGQPGQSAQAHDFGQQGQSRGTGQDGQDGQPGRPGNAGHPLEQAGRRAAAADVVPDSTPTPGRFDRNL